MVSISAADLVPVADDGLHHKSVLKMTNAVAGLCLTPLDTWKRGGKKISSKLKLVVGTSACKIAMATLAVLIPRYVVISWNRIHICTRSRSLLHHQSCTNKRKQRKRYCTCTSPPPQRVWMCPWHSQSESQSRKFPCCAHTRTHKQIYDNHIGGFLNCKLQVLTGNSICGCFCCFYGNH